DRVLKVNGSEVTSFNDLSSAIVLSNPDEPLILDVERDGKLLLPKPQVLPEFKSSESVRQLGIGNGTSRRVLVASIWTKEEPGPDDLRKHDELYKLVINGEAKEFKDRGVFYRAMVEARGAPVDVIVKRPVKPDDLPDEAAVSGKQDIESREAKAKISA